jgi:VWFA-related protein
VKLGQLRSRKLRLSLLVLGCVVAGGWFQAPAPSPAGVPPPTIRATTHLVLVDVVVTDKQGKPVTGLHPEDFVVEESGKRQKISTFGIQRDNATAPAPALPPGVYSNKAAYRTTGGPLVVLLLDALNTPFKDQAYARQQMLRFVQEQYQPGLRMAVFTLTGSLHVLQDFTSDPQILYTALQRYKPQEQEFANAVRPTTGVAGPSNAGGVVTALDPGARPVGGVSVVASDMKPRLVQIVSVVQAAIQNFAGAQVAYVEDQRVALTIAALNSLSRILGGLAGRKSIIWVTGGFPFPLIPEERNMNEAELEESLPSLDTRRVSEHAAGNYAATYRQAHADDIRETSARLSGAQVSVYPVDARGLSISTEIDAQETMREIARETGGRAYVNQNEIRYGVARAIEDESATYTLGYYPENKKYDGKYRQIKVKVNRDAVEVLHRRGYYAIDLTSVKGYNPNQEAAAALVDAVPATLVAFSAQVRPPAQNSVKGKVGVTFLVDAATFSAEEASGGKHLNIAFFATQYSPDGKMLDDASQKVDQTFDAATYQQILQHGLMLHLDLEPKPGADQLRLAVQDNRTGMVGTINAPLDQ